MKLFQKPFNEWLGGLAQFGTLLTVAAYGYGWIVSSLFFNHFNLSPEDVGINFDWLAVRSFLVAVVVSVVVVIIRFIYKKSDSERYKTLRDQSVILVIDLLHVLRIRLEIPVERKKTVGILLLKIASGVLTGFMIALLLALPYKLSGNLARNVMSGQEVHILLLPGINAFQVDRVRIFFINAGQSLSRTGVSSGATGLCLMYLGGNSGDSYFYSTQSERVLEINDQNIMASDPC